jgi:sugar phosphate permease
MTMPLNQTRISSPDGNSFRWIVCAMTWAAFTTTFVDRLAWGNLQLQVGEALGLPLAALGVFVSALYAGYVLSNAVTGYFADVLGPRLMLSTSTVLLGFATAGFGSIQTVATGLVLQALMGFAAGADYAACVKLLTNWFPPNLRGRAIGLWFTGSSVAVILTNSIVPVLASAVTWQGAYRVLGGITLLVGVLSWIILRDAPERSDLQTAIKHQKPDLKRLLRNRNIMLVALAGFGALWGTWGFAFWSNSLMVKGYGMQPGRVAAIVATYGVGAAIAKPLIGWLSDWLGGVRKPLALACLAAFALMLLLYGLCASEAAFWIATPILGVTAFAYSPLLTALVAELAGKDSAGSASGVTNAFWQLGSLLVPLVVGAVFSATGSFFAAFAALACGPLLGLCALIAVREQRAKA